MGDRDRVVLTPEGLGGPVGIDITGEVAAIRATDGAAVPMTLEVRG